MSDAGPWTLMLYVSGASPQSLRAIETVRGICDEELSDISLEVVDLQKQPDLAARDQVVVVPTLVRRSPGRPLRLVGGLADAARLRGALGLGPADAVVGLPDWGL